MNSWWGKTRVKTNTKENRSIKAESKSVRDLRYLGTTQFMQGSDRNEKSQKWHDPCILKNLQWNTNVSTFFHDYLPQTLGIDEFESQNYILYRVVQNPIGIERWNFREVYFTYKILTSSSFMILHWLDVGGGDPFRPIGFKSYGVNYPVKLQ